MCEMSCSGQQGCHRGTSRPAATVVGLVWSQWQAEQAGGPVLADK